MTVQSTVPFRKDYEANGTTNVFAYPFQIYDAADLTVYLNGTVKTLNTDYTVSDVGNANGGNITFNMTDSNDDPVDIADGDDISIVMDMDLDRTTNYQPSGAFLAADVNDDFDRLWLATNQQAQEIDRSLRLKADDITTSNMEIPAKDDRKGKLLGFNATTGDPEVSDNNKDNWNAAYNDKINSASFSGSTLTLTQQDGGTVTASHTPYLPIAGGSVTGDIDFGSSKAIFGSNDDLQIYNFLGASIIKEAGSGNLEIRATDLVLKDDSGGKYAQFTEDGDAKLFYDNDEKLATTSGGISVTGTITATGYNDSNWNTAYGWGDHSTAGYLTSESNDLSATVTWANVPDANITESSVTQHQSALSITESQISDLQSYITDYNVTQSDVTAHQAALSITESQISDLQSYLTSFDITTQTDPKYLRSDVNDTTTGTITAAGLIAGGNTYPTTTGSNGQVLVTNGSGTLSFADQSGGIALTDLSVGSENTASGDGAIDYNNATGVFNYTPPDLSSYLTSFDITTQTDPKYLRADTSDTTTGTLTAAGLVVGEITLPTTDGSANQVIVTDGSGNLSFANQSGGGGGGLSNIVEDTTPQLGGDLDVNNKNIDLGDADLARTQNMIRFGAGSDMEIFSDGSQGVIEGHLHFNCTSVSGSVMGKLTSMYLGATPEERWQRFILTKATNGASKYYHFRVKGYVNSEAIESHVDYDAYLHVRDDGASTNAYDLDVTGYEVGDGSIQIGMKPLSHQNEFYIRVPEDYSHVETYNLADDTSEDLKDLITTTTTGDPTGITYATPKIRAHNNETIEFADGTHNAPSITFANDTDTGISRVIANTLDFSVGGNDKMRLFLDGSQGKLLVNSTFAGSYGAVIRAQGKIETSSGFVSTSNSTQLRSAGYFGGAGLTIDGYTNNSTSTQKMIALRNSSNFEKGNIQLKGNHVLFGCASGNYLFGATTAHTPTAKVDIDGDTIRLRSDRTPSSATDTGNKGDICYDSNYMYVCVATNTWKRIALATW